jgi:hypothetical protein
METEEITSTRETAKSFYSEESERSRTKKTHIPDPGSSLHSSADPPPAGFIIHDTDLDNLRLDFPTLAKYSDDFLRSTPWESLIRGQAATLKIRELEKGRLVEDRLTLNQDSLQSTKSKIEAGEDNRLDILHAARFLPGMACSAAKMWLMARDVIGPNGIPPISTYDMSAVGLAGYVQPKGWIEISNPGSPNMKLRLFNINNVNSSSGGGGNITFGGSSVCFGEDQKEMQNVGEFKLALRAARTAMSFALPWNFSVQALEGFMHISEYCSKDLTGEAKPAVVLSQFCDFIFAENAKRWRGKEPFVAQGEMRSYWEAFYGSRPKSQPEKKATETKKFTGSNAAQQQRTARPFENICRNWNVGKCTKPAGQCKSPLGTPLRHCCNHRTDLNDPATVCGGQHTRVGSGNH